MNKEMAAEFEKIKQTVIALGPRLYSSDQRVAEKAKSELKGVGGSLDAWAKKSGVTLTPHREEPSGTPETMKKCALLIYPVINGKVHECVLVGQDGRKCLYSCSVATLSPI